MRIQEFDIVKIPVLAGMILFLFNSPTVFSEINSTSKDQETWANWDRRLDRAFDDITPRKIPGRALAILVPNEVREDLLPLTALGYEAISVQSIRTVVFLMPAPASLNLDGIVMPGLERIDSSIGGFPVDVFLASQLRNDDLNIKIDNAPFGPFIPPVLETQLAMLKYILKGTPPM